MSTVLQERARRFYDLFGVSVPVLNAPMMGVTTPAMVAAVAAAGGLGVLPGDRLTAEELRQAIRDTRALTDKPFAVNLRVPAKRENTDNEQSVHEAMSELKALLGCPTEYVPHPITPFEDLFDVVVDERIPVVSVSFGGLREIYADKLKALGVKTIGAATTLREAKVMRSAEVDAVVVQGVEAGGPRLNFEQPDADSLVGLMSLIGPSVRATRLPVIAAGGIMTGAQMAACLMAGATAVQVGTLLLRTPESAAHPLHKAALEYASDSSTRLTRVFNGRLTRVIPNGLVEAVEESGVELADYPSQWRVMAPIHAAARAQDRDDLMPMPAGQGAALARTAPAYDVLSNLVNECRRCFGLKD
ncbi:MAG: nitronate monooxygenase [Duodenibacillus sp.]|nr:nitronate monooxygenase [Duodenibacillus sp.]